MKSMCMWWAGLLFLSGCARVSEDAWRTEWALTACAADANKGEAGYLPYGWHGGEVGPEMVNRPPYEGRGRHVGIMLMHPISINEPARLQYRGELSALTPVLTVTAAGNVQGDTVLRCLVGEQVAGEAVLDGLAWREVRFDLSPFFMMGQAVPLELQIAAGGAEPWKFEHGFIDRVAFGQQ